VQSELLEQAANFLSFAVAHETGVHINAVDAARTEGALRQGESDSRINTSTQEKEHSAPARVAANSGFEIRDLVGGMPVAAAPADPKQEIAQNLQAVLGVGDFGMKLDADQAAGVVPHSGDAAIARAAENLKAGRQLGNVIAMTHPNPLAAVQAGEYGFAGFYDDFRFAEFAGSSAGRIAPLPRLDFAAEMLGQEVLSVADAENRQVELEQTGIRLRAARVKDARRTSGNDHAAVARQPLRSRAERPDFRIDPQFADFPGDEMTILAAGIEDNNLFHAWLFSISSEWSDDASRRSHSEAAQNR